MYHRKDNCTSEFRDEFITGVEEFDRFARSQNEYNVNGVYRCPCTKCKNAKYLIQMILNSISIRKNLSEIIEFGQVMGRFMTYIMERAALLVVGMRPLQLMVTMTSLILEVTTTIIWMSC